MGIFMRANWVAFAAFAVLGLSACESVQGVRVVDPIDTRGLGDPPPPVQQSAENTGVLIGDDEGFEPYVRMSSDSRASNQVVRTGSGAFSVNFTDASLPEVVQTILGDLLNERFMLDPRVQGRVTVSSATPLDRDALLALLEAAAANNGAALSRRDDTWMVLPTQAGARGGVLPASAAGAGVTVVPLENVAAQDMVNLLQGVAAPADLMRADAARNVVIVRGSGPERRAVSDLLLAFDTEWARGRATALLPLRNAAAETVATELLSAMQAGEGGPRAAAIQVQPVERLNALLVLAGSNSLLAEARGWVERLDVAVSTGATLRSYPIENGEAEVTAQLISDLFGLQSSGRSTRRAVASDLDSNTVASPDAGRSGSSPARAGASGSAPRGLEDMNIRLTADPLNNTVLVLASPAGHALVEQALGMIDRPPAQVLLDAMIAEVTLNDTLRYGVQWFFETNGIDGVADTGRGGFGETGFDADGTFPGFNFIMESQNSARLAIDALSGVTDLRVVSSPSIVVLNNRTATLNVGDQVPIITRSASSVVDPDAPIVNSVEFRDTGVILTVTPQISSTGMVTLDIEQEISNVASRTAQGNASASGNPTISQRSIVTTVSARSGQTVALGGLIGENRDGQRSGVPGLSDLPVIGGAFRNESISTQRTELLIFITPRIINDEYGAASIMRELRDRFELMGPQGDTAPAQP